MISAHAHPTFELSDAVPLLAKTAAREQKLESRKKNPLLSGNPLPYLTGKVPDHVAHEVVLVLHVDLPLYFWLMFYYFFFSFVLLLVLYIHVTPIDYSHGCDHKVKTLTSSFWQLTVDHAEFWGFDH